MMIGIIFLNMHTDKYTYGVCDRIGSWESQIVSKDHKLRRGLDQTNKQTKPKKQNKTKNKQTKNCDKATSFILESNGGLTCHHDGHNFVLGHGGLYMCPRDRIFPSNVEKRHTNKLLSLSQAAASVFIRARVVSVKYIRVWQLLLRNNWWGAGLPSRLRYHSHYRIPLELIIYIKEEEN